MAYLKEHQRMFWADIMRIIAIYFVVQIHTFSAFNNMPLFISLVEKITIICVPVFVMLSGALLLGKQEDSKTFFVKRVFKVLLPWLLWTFFYMYFNFTFREHNEIVKTFFNNHNNQFTQWFAFFVRTFLSNLWFLPLIFGLYLLTPALRVLIHYGKDKDIYFLLILWFLIFSVGPFLKNSPLFPTFEPSIFFAPFQYSGYFILGYCLVTKKFFVNIPLWILFLIIFLTFAISTLPIKSFYIEFFLDRFTYPGVVIESVVAFLLSYHLLQKLDTKIKPRFRNMITAISKASFGVYIIHEIIAFFFLKYALQFFQQYMLIYGFTLAIFLLSVGFVIFIQKISFGKYFFP